MIAKCLIEEMEFNKGPAAAAAAAAQSCNCNWAAWTIFSSFSTSLHINPLFTPHIMPASKLSLCAQIVLSTKFAFFKRSMKHHMCYFHDHSELKWIWKSAGWSPREDDEVKCFDAGNRGVHISTSLTRLDGALDVKLWTDQKIGPFSYLNPNFNIISN